MVAKSVKEEKTGVKDIVSFMVVVMYMIMNLACVWFIVAKLTGSVDWPWVWVMSPAWLPFLIFGVILIMVAVVGSVVATIWAVFEKILKVLE